MTDKKFMVIGQIGGRYWVRIRNIATREEAIAKANGCTYIDRSKTRAFYHAVEILETFPNQGPSK